MKKSLRPRCRAWLPALVLGLACAPPLLAQSLPFAGKWLPDGPAGAGAPATRLTIDDARLTWRGPGKSAPPCVQAFALENERPGTVYLDGRGTRFVAGAKGSLPTYRLDVEAAACGGLGKDVRISFPLVYDTRHIDIIEYVNGKPVSSRRFRRQR